MLVSYSQAAQRFAFWIQVVLAAKHSYESAATLAALWDSVC